MDTRDASELLLELVAAPGDLHWVDWARAAAAEAIQVCELGIHPAKDQAPRALGAGFDRVALTAAALDLAEKGAQRPVERDRIPDRRRNRAVEQRDPGMAEAARELGGRDVLL